MANEITIPLLPCHSINKMLDFYQALDFEVTYQQDKPNNYAVVVRGGIELHFFTMPKYVPAESYSSCYVRVCDVDELYRSFCDGLRQKYRRVPSAGIPRVIPLKNKTGRREFIVVDPRGNWIRIGQVAEASPTEKNSEDASATTKLSRAINAATALEEAGYYARAAKRIDDALEQKEACPAAERVQALVFRAGVAITQGDFESARKRLEEVRQMSLSENEFQQVVAELHRADELEQLVSEQSSESTDVGGRTSA